MAKYALLGKNISYSFSKGYFSEKFEREQLDHTYENFDIAEITELPKLLESNPTLKGFNVTIPYKEAILPYLHSLDEEARKIGAVNTVKITEGNRLIGYNTDHIGFQQSLLPFLPLANKKALILGTGGASKAVAQVLEKLEWEWRFVSRKPRAGQLPYAQLNEHQIKAHSLLVNTTPLGTFPKVEAYPDIPYQYLGSQHLLYDLIYNPPLTEFLRRGKTQGARVVNGLSMLQLQAEAAWSLWND